MSTKRKTTFDQLNEQGRSTLMGKIRSKNTKPELILRKALFRDGLRYRIHRKDLPGKPDVSVLKYHLVIEARGCFWHGHSNCKNGHTPRKNTGFWIDKLNKNMERDRKNLERLTALGYKVFIIWECEIQTLRGLDSKLLPIYQYLNKNFGLNLQINTNK